METKHAILYLDDEEQNLIAFQALLRKDYRVFTTTDAHEATEILSRENIAVIFSDQKMPDVSGVEFFENIIHEYPTPVRILLTGHADIEAVIDAINKGQVYRYVSKPWESGDLKICIENAVEKYQRDADLMMKKTSLLKIQGEMAIAQVLNLLYQWMTSRWTENSVSMDRVELTARINAQQQIFLLNKILSDSYNTPLAQPLIALNPMELIETTMKCCDRLTPSSAALDLKNSLDVEKQSLHSAALVCVILIAANLLLRESMSVSPKIELIENQEKFVGKILLEGNSGFDESANIWSSMEVIRLCLSNYLLCHRGAIQWEGTSNSLRIIFEGQKP